MRCRPAGLAQVTKSKRGSRLSTIDTLHGSARAEAAAHFGRYLKGPGRLALDYPAGHRYDHPNRIGPQGRQAPRQLALPIGAIQSLNWSCAPAQAHSKKLQALPDQSSQN